MPHALSKFRSISLRALERAAPLSERIDTKYVVRSDQLEQLLNALSASHRALEIGGDRSFAYSTTYYDTPDLQTFREHRGDRRRRFKIRRRRYLDNGCASLEVKLKGRRGCTVKHSVPDDDGATLSSEALDFAREILLTAYERDLPSPLVPALTAD